MKMPRTWFACSLCLGALALLAAAVSPVQAEGSRNLYPASYPSVGSRANLDLQPNQRYMGRVLRRGFNYVYAEAGEYILLGSSNRANGDSSDIRIYYEAQGYGIPGDETLPGSSVFSCTSGSVQPGVHYSGATLGRINQRSQELAGPRSANNAAAVPGNGFTPCAYQAPATGIYGVQFEASSGGAGTSANPNGTVGTGNAGLPRVTNSVAAWDIVVRSDASSVTDINGRVYTYAFLGYTGGNNRPVFSTLFYVTSDGYRYRQELRGLDPNGYALYANTFAFFDNNQPLYKNLRGSNAQVTPLPFGVTVQAAEFPIFFSNIASGGPAESEAEKVLGALGIPLVPPSPQISNVAFSGAIADGVTSAGAGGTFRFNTSATVSYQVVISRDGVDFDPATPLNRVLTGIAFAGQHQVVWDGLDNDMTAFPARSQPYSYRAYGRNGEVHFPIIDAENNGNPSNPNVPGGGPTIIRLNGTDPGDTTVFFDDRGYVISSGLAVGELNGEFCAPVVNAPQAATPDVSLEGVDSTTSYRRWDYGNNRNIDCAPGAGWGDAKAVNLWTYFLTPQISLELIIQDAPVDVATTVSIVNSAVPGESVQGTFAFSNNGSTAAAGVTYAMTLTKGLTGVTFANLPSGVTAVYNPGTGDVSFAGFPVTLTPGQTFIGLTYSFTAPNGGPVEVSTAITTSDTDSVPENNTASAQMGVGLVDVATLITGVPAEAVPGSVVSGSVQFANLGTEDAVSVTYALTVGDSGSAPADFVFTELPAGVTASYNAADGQVSFTGMPDTLPVGLVLAFAFEYTAPLENSPPVLIEAEITTSSADSNSTNNTDDAQTNFVYAPSASISLQAQAVCINDAPYIQYNITPENFVPNNLATIEFIGSDNSVVDTLTDQALSGGQLLWPDAAVDTQGQGEAWPGWEFVSGQWSQVPSLVRPALRVRVSVNPIAEVTLSYPPPTQACNTNPPGQSGLTAAAIPAMSYSQLVLLALALMLIAGIGRSNIALR